MKGTRSGGAVCCAFTLSFVFAGLGCQVIRPVVGTAGRVIEGTGQGLEQFGKNTVEGVKGLLNPNGSAAQASAVPAGASARPVSARLAPKKRVEVAATAQPVSHGCSDFARVQAEQKHEEWCWAACAQMVYKYHGIDVKQEDIAKRIVGQKDVQTAGEYEIVRALSETDELWADKFGNLHNGGQIRFNPAGLVAANVALLTKNNKYLLVQQLLRGEPCIAGLMVAEGFGHAVVVFDVTYTATPNALGQLNALGQPAPANAKGGGGAANAGANAGGGGLNILGLKIPPVDVQIVSVKIFDPARGMGVRELRGADLDKQLKFVISRESVREYNEELENALQVKPNGRVAGAR